MEITEYQKIKEILIDRGWQIENDKRPSYTIGSEDVLANFKRVADRANTGATNVAVIYLLKHIDSILAMVNNPDLPQAEPVLDRFADASNYLALLLALLVEELDWSIIKQEKCDDQAE